MLTQYFYVPHLIKILILFTILMTFVYVMLAEYARTYCYVFLSMFFKSDYVVCLRNDNNYDKKKVN